MKKNDVTRFLYYMWNNWNEVECRRAFKDAPCGSEYLWQKWCLYVDELGRDRAVTNFYADIDNNLKNMLVDRALEVQQ